MGSTRIKQIKADNVGSIIFSNTGGYLGENNSNLSWDNTNLRIGIGTNDPFNDQVTYTGDATYASYLVLKTADGSYGINHNTGSIEIATYIDSTFTGVESMIGTTSAHGFGIFANDQVRIIVKSTGQVGINSGFSALTGAFTVIGTGTTTGTLGLSVHNSTGTSNSFIVRDDGSSGMGVAFASIAARLHINGLGATTATSALTVHNSTGTSNSLIVRNDASIGIGVALASIVARLHINGLGATSATSALTVHNSAGNTNSLIVRNDASVGMGVALATISARLQIHGLGATSATFALKVHNSGGANNMLMVRNDGLIGINVAAPTAYIDLLNNVSAVANGILATSSGATAVAIAATGNFTNTRTGATTGNVGIIGSATSNANRNIGVVGLGGNATLTAPITTAIGVLGQIPTATTTVTSYGGYFSNLSTSATTKGGVYSELSGTVASGTSYGYRLVHSGINTGGSAYGGHYVITGANTNNYGLYLESSGATNNYGLITNGTIFNGLGIAAPTATLHIVGSGTTSSTFGLRVHNSTGTSNTLVVRDDSRVGINTIDWTSGAGGLISKFAVRDAQGDLGYHTVGLFENSLNPTVNNGNDGRALTASTIKYGAFNTYGVTSLFLNADNQGGGNINIMSGAHSYIIQRGAGAITYTNGFYADKQQSDGTITYNSSFTADMTSMSAGTVTHVVGLYVKSPSNILGGTRTNTYGVLIESNTTGTNNWGVYQSGIGVNNYFNGAVRIGSSSDFGAKLSIETPAALTYGIYLNPFNLAAGGSGIYITGQATGAGNYYGLRSYAPGGSATGDNIAIWGWSEGTSATNNYGGYFISRNGATGSYGIYAAVAGGDSVNSANSAGVVGQNESVASTTKRGGWFYSTNNVNSGTAFGVDAYSLNAGTSAINYGVRGRGLASGATVTNYGGYFSADGGTSATNYGLYVTASGGATNWGVYQDGSTAENYFNSVVRIGATSGAGKLFVRGTGTGSGTTNFRFEASDSTLIMESTDQGHIGINSAPSTGDRLKINAGSGKDGALNINASNVNDGGYGILVQGSGGSNSIYGIWSDVVGGASNGWAFRGSAGSSGVQNNYGGYFSARNGTTSSIGAYCIVPGGDSVNSTDSAAVFASNGSTQSTSKKGVWAIVTTAVNNGTSYGVKAEVDTNGTNAINYAFHGRVNAAGATVTNYGGWFQADGASSATNYALVTNGGLVGIGTTTPTALLEVVGGQFFVAQDTDTVGTSTVTIDFAESNNKLIDMQPATGNVTVTLSNPKSGASYFITVIQGSGGFNLIWPGTVLWPGGTAPTITVTNDAIDFISLYYNGTNYLARYNQAFA